MRTVFVLILVLFFAVPVVAGESGGQGKQDGWYYTDRVVEDFHNTDAKEEATIRELCRDYAKMVGPDDYRRDFWRYGGNDAAIGANNATKTLQERFPGSTFSCFNGGGIMAIGARRELYNNWRKIRENSQLDNGVNWESSRSDDGSYIVKESDDRNFVIFNVPAGDIKKARIIDVHLPVLAETAAEIKGSTFTQIRQNELIDLLNVVYDKFWAPAGVNFFQYGISLMLKLNERKYALQCIEKVLTRQGGN